MCHSHIQTITSVYMIYNISYDLYYLNYDFLQAVISSGKKLINENKIDSMQSELDQCKSGNQDAVITRKELDLCRDQLSDELISKKKLNQSLQNVKQNITMLEVENQKVDQSLFNANRNITILKNENQKLNQGLQSAKLNIKTLQKDFDLCRDELTVEQNSKEQFSQNLSIAKENINAKEEKQEVLQEQLNSEREANENLRNRIRQLENEKNRIQSETSKRGLTNGNQNLQSLLETCQRERRMNCGCPIVGNNGLSLLKNHSEIQACQDHGNYDEPESSLLIFHFQAKDGNNERAIITRGLSTYMINNGGKYILGNKDKIITSFNSNGEVKYSLQAACGVTYQGLIHIFGGFLDGYQSQHFGFDEKRNFVKYENLEISFWAPQCSTFKISKPNSQPGNKEVVLLCFDTYHQKNCFQYDDDELTHFADANVDHFEARLGKYKDQLITVGSSGHQKAEILDRYNNGKYKWTLGRNYNFSPTGIICQYSTVNVPQIGSNEEFLLLIGGQYGGFTDRVHKYNGKWSLFGNLKKTRAFHDSVFLNGRVFIIGGSDSSEIRGMKTETWDTSKPTFETESIWPALGGWISTSNNVFIIPDYMNT